MVGLPIQSSCIYSGSYPVRWWISLAYFTVIRCVIPLLAFHKLSSPRATSRSTTLRRCLCSTPDILFSRFFSLRHHVIFFRVSPSISRLTICSWFFKSTTTAVICPYLNPYVEKRKEEREDKMNSVPSVGSKYLVFPSSPLYHYLVTMGSSSN